MTVFVGILFFLIAVAAVYVFVLKRQIRALRFPADHYRPEPGSGTDTKRASLSLSCRSSAESSPQEPLASDTMPQRHSKIDSSRIPDRVPKPAKNPMDAEHAVILNHSALTFLANPGENFNIPEYVGKTLAGVLGNCVIVVNSITEDGLRLRSEGFWGSERTLIGKSIKAIGFDPTGSEFVIRDDMHSMFTQGKVLEFEGTFGDFVGDAIPRSASEAIRRIIGIQKIYSIGFTRGTDLYGNIHFLWRSKQEIQHTDWIEAFVHQASIALHRQFLEKKLREAKDVAIYANKAKGDFVANMSHEIRTPLNGIVGMIELVLMTELTDEQRDYLESARFSVHSLHGIVNDILDFSRIESGRLNIEAISFELKPLLKRVVDGACIQLKDRPVSMNLEVGDGVPEFIVGDSVRLRQILINLTGNAVKFTEKGKIDVKVALESADQEGESVELRFIVSDTGVGIEQSKLETIFDSFTQADSSTTREYGGTGLGLAISRKLGEMLGGTLRARSAPGRGSAFTITLPFQLPTGTNRVSGVPEDVPELELPAEASKLKVLVAEDNEINRRITTALLTKLGCRVTEVENGKKALAVFKKERPDLVLMDVQMPEMDGLKTTRKIRALESSGGSHATIVAMTARAMKEDRQQCLDSGMDDYLPKPVSLALLRRVIVRSSERVDHRKQHYAEESTMDTTSESSNATDFDNTAFIHRLQGDTDLARETLSAFVSILPARLEEIDQAFGENEMEKVREYSHTMKGTCSTVSAVALTEHFRRIHECVDTGKPEDIPRVIENARDAAGRFHKAVREYI